MIQFPEMSESDIEKWVGNIAFQRGYRYFEDETILNPRRRGQSLIAECQGSQPAPYRVEIRLGAEDILEGSCTCSGGEGGHCKHAAALLLTWIHEPNIFIEVPDLEHILSGRSQEDLISLIQEMVSRYPALEQLIELSALRILPSGEILKPELIAQQIRRAFLSAGGERGDNVSIAQNLQTILDLGEDFLDSEDLPNAAVVYATLMEGMLAYEDCLYHDQGGDLGQVLAECEQGIRDCLSASQEPELRKELLNTLFDLYLWDLQAGGLGFADETPTILIGQTTLLEKHMIAELIQEELPDGEDWNDNVQRRALGGLWLALMSVELDDETYLRICRETGRIQDLVDRLLSLGRVDEAAETARSAGKYNLTAISDLFDAHGYPEMAWQIVHEQPGSEADIQLLGWLKQYALHHNQPDEALRLAEMLFWQEQSLENYNDLLETGELLGEQTNVRARVIKRLENAGNFSLLVEIYLLENEIDQALTALERVKPEIWGDRLTLLRRQLAYAVEVLRPREAIRQYLLLAEELIEQRSRGSYAEAALLLQRVRKLYRSLGEEDQSEEIIQSLLSEYQRFPMLMDEMRRAGL